MGELQKAVLDRCYKFDSVSIEEIRAEAVQVAAMAIRFMESLSEYQWRAGEQHMQRVPCAACDRGDYQLGHADGCLANEKPEMEKLVEALSAPARKWKWVCELCHTTAAGRRGAVARTESLWLNFPAA